MQGQSMKTKILTDISVAKCTVILADRVKPNISILDTCS